MLSDERLHTDSTRVLVKKLSPTAAASKLPLRRCARYVHNLWARTPVHRCKCCTYSRNSGREKIFMQVLTGKTAFITGAAEGIGFHIARTFAQQGMNVMLADIDAAMLEQARQTLKDEGHSVAAVVCDVAQRDALEAAAKATLERFGKVHVLVNNAGVSVAGPQDRISENNWRWIIDVNLMGVVYGAQVFVPLIKEHGEGGHVIKDR